MQWGNLSLIDRDALTPTFYYYYHYIFYCVYQTGGGSGGGSGGGRDRGGQGTTTLLRAWHVPLREVAVENFLRTWHVLADPPIGVHSL